MDLSDLAKLLGLRPAHVVVTGVWVSLLMGYVTWAFRREPLKSATWATYVKRTLVIVLPVAVNAGLHQLSAELCAVVAEAGLAAGGASLGYVLRKRKAAPAEPSA